MSPIDISDEPLAAATEPMPWDIAPVADEPDERFERRGPRPSWRRTVLRETVMAFGIAALVGAVAALNSFERQFRAAWEQGIADFRWTVLVQGTQLEIDEVGRFLHQLDG